MDDDWPEVVHNLSKAQKKWEKMLWVLGREGVDDWTLGPFYVVVLQAVFLYKLETWIMSPRIGRTMVDFHHRVVSVSQWLSPLNIPVLTRGRAENHWMAA